MVGSTWNLKMWVVTLRAHSPWIGALEGDPTFPSIYTVFLKSIKIILPTFSDFHEDGAVNRKVFLNSKMLFIVLVLIFNNSKTENLMGDIQDLLRYHVLHLMA